MAAAWCLPRDLSSAFLKAIQDGTISPDRLAEMTSAERRAEFGKILGEDNAREVNAEFESKLLLKDFKKGLVNWANKLAGLSEPARRDILATINRLDRVLNPDEEQAFLEDLAAKKLGTTVTAEEARTIYQFAQTAEARRQEMLQSGWTPEKGTAYGRAVLDLTDYVESLKPNGRTWADRTLNVIGLSKPMLTSVLHLSAMGVQGWGMISTRVAWEGFARMFLYFGREEAFQDLQAYIIGHPDYEISKQAKLGITKLGDKLSAREESIQSTLLEEFNGYLSEKTGVPNVIRASSRAFTGYLNYVRFNRFTDLLNAARMAGEDIRPGSKAAQDLADVVNDFTGRSSRIHLGFSTPEINSDAASVLNAVFFAPKKMAATMQMFNPVRFADPRISPTARLAAVRQLTGSLLATGAVLWLAKSVGAQVSFDPRSSDFAKIVLGGERMEVTGGNASYIRLLGRLVTGESINAHGKLTEIGQGYKPTTRADLVVSFLRGKLAPIAGMMTDALYGSDPGGRPFSVTHELQEKLLPITLNSWMDFWQNDPDRAAHIVPAMAAMFGIGLESPAPPISATGLDAWGQPMQGSGTPPSWSRDPVNQEAERLGYTPRPAPDTIRGVTLTEAQHHEFVELSGQLAHMRLQSLVQSEYWGHLPSGTRLSMMKSTVMKAREAAATSVMLQAQGGENDIVRKATAAKQAALGVPAL